MKCLELSIFFRCLNRCVFCSNSSRMARFARAPLSRSEIGETLAQKRREGYGVVSFNGGEPTLYPLFWEVLREAKDLGYRTQLVTSGGPFDVEGFARRTLPFLDEVCVSLHGDTAAVHDGLTLNGRSFGRLRAALRAIDRFPRDIAVVVNTVVTSRNVGRVGRIAAWACGRRKVRQFWLSTLIPEGRALENYARLAVPWKEALRQVPAIAKAVDARGAALRLFGFPLCVLGPYRARASELHKEPGMALTRVEDGGKRTSARRRRSRGVGVDGGGPVRIKTARCSGCRLDALCAGAWEPYVRLFGDGELEAVRS
ncbi:MAG: radical SAM protein [Elusimicrobia bacterium]|nr:radical SAM protein [Elusimicrobiota bacterium]